MKILVVDDAPIVRTVLKFALQSHGFDVFEAADGLSALGVAEEHDIDVLVTDIVMEPMDGISLARSLTARRPETPVLFISGFPLDIDNERRHYARCAFLPKPFDGDELVRAVRELAGAKENLISKAAARPA